MKKLLTIITIMLIFSSYSLSEEMLSKDYEGEFYISKVNRIEKIWEIPPDRRGFMGDRIIIRKFNYARELDIDKRGEEYVVSWQYKGKELEGSLLVKFEYITANNTLDEPFVEECKQEGVKRGGHKWVFPNIGEEFIKKGNISSWKVSLVYDDRIVADKRSANWYALKGT